MSTGSVTPFQPDVASGDKFSPSKRLSDIKQLYTASHKYIEENYWDELVEAYRAVKVRTNPIMIMKNGKEVEDTNRTNVCMPDLNTIVKRKTARKTANPPTLNYYVPGDGSNLLAERLTSRAYYEYDRSGEAFEFKRGVNQADIFGYSYFKTYYDTVDVQRQMRYQVAKLTSRNDFMKAQGAGQEQIQAAIAKQGDTVGPQELDDYITQNGPEIRGQQPYTMYEGPVTKCRFIGDMFLEPACLTLDHSSYVIERYTETDLWLRKMAAKTYLDPDSQKEVPVFDREKVQELWDKESKLSQDRVDDLRKELRASIQKAEPNVEQRLLPGKRFDIMEYHGPDKNGRMWIEYIGNDSVYLGRQPYPFDLCGKFVYSEYVPWPDIIGAIGDSSPRVLRFLHAMHNANSGQIIDLVNQVLCRTYKVSSAADIPDEAIRKDFGMFLVMKNGDMNSVQAFVEPDVPVSAWQTQAMIKQELRENDPSLGGVDQVGTDYSPGAGRTATTAILSAKSSDVLMQSEIDALNLTLKELGTKKLEIHRQLSDKPIEVPNRPQYVKSQALSQRFDKTSAITIDPYEIQDPSIDVEPLAGSTLAVDDEMRAGKLQSAYQMAEQDPLTWNKYEVAKSLATTFKGVGDTSKWLNPRPTGPPPPPPPKVSINVSIPLDKMPADVQNEALQMGGFQPSQDATAKGQMDAVIHASKASDAAANLISPAHQKDPTDQALKGQETKVQDKINAAP